MAVETEGNGVVLVIASATPFWFDMVEFNQNVADLPAQTASPVAPEQQSVAEF
jgi:hypothetical protein